MSLSSRSEAGGNECLEEWQTNCDDLSKFLNLHVKPETDNRLICEIPPPPLPAKNGPALRATVEDGDVALTLQGTSTGSGWRAEAVGPIENQGGPPVHYRWSTLLPQGYPVDPQPASGTGGRPWQVIFQWHQGHTDIGGSPPVEIIIEQGKILLSTNRPNPANSGQSLPFCRWYLCDAATEIWHDFELEISWRLEGGSIKAWYGGAPVTFQPQTSDYFPDLGPHPVSAGDTISGLMTMFDPQDPQGTPTVYMKVGLYRKPVATIPPGPYVLYHDEIQRCVLNT